MRVNDIKEHIGEKYNYLTITDVFRSKPYINGRTSTLVKVICDCGNETTTSYDALKQGKCVSCGCHRKKYDNSAMAKAYREYMFSAKKRGYEFNLSHDEFYKLVEQPCHYCGTSPMRNTDFNGDSYNHNGIDRVDNSKGYSIDNCVPCCTICNHAKMDMPYNEFIDWINRLIKFRKEVL
jgi:hypothetical protein